jgi:hypothetical protein
MPSADSSGVREAGLRRLALAKRWILGASVAVVGVLTAIFANALPGKTLPGSSAAQGASSSPLTPPEQSPQSAVEQPSHEVPSVQQSEAGSSSAEAPVISGGS